MQYFSIDELISNSVAKRLGLSNVPDDTAKLHLKSLVESVLDPLRRLYGRPINVSTSYRSRALNKITGDASPFDVEHTLGNAADLVVAEGDEGLRYLAELAISYGLPFDTMAIENGHLHISHRHAFPQQRSCYVMSDGEWSRVSIEQFWCITLGRDLPVIYWGNL